MLKSLVRRPCHNLNEKFSYLLILKVPLGMRCAKLSFEYRRTREAELPGLDPQVELGNQRTSTMDLSLWAEAENHLRCTGILSLSSFGSPPAPSAPHGASSASFGPTGGRSCSRSWCSWPRPGRCSPLVKCFARWLTLDCRPAQDSSSIGP